MKHFLFAALMAAGLSTALQADPLLAGAATADISPRKLPAIRNGGFLQGLWKRVDDPLFARALVIKSGPETVALCVVDSCMLPTDVCEQIKTLVTQHTGIPDNRILISATHTHSAPSTMAMCLGTRKDEAYTAQMIPQVAAAITTAHKRLKEAKAGWTAVDAHAYTNCRRWIRRPDKVGQDPFGDKTIRAMMHPGYLSADSLAPSGPTDPQLSLLSFVDAQSGKPLCVLANYSMHYFGSGDGFSADYPGEVSRGLEKALGGETVGIVAQGTSGDQHWMDYSRAKKEGYTRQQYSEGLTALAMEAWKQIQHRPDLPVTMAEAKLPLGRRLPSPERLKWAATLNEQRGTIPPRNQPEVYAEQAAWIHDNPKTELVLQALKIGDLGIAAMPNEVFGITGLKIKQQSPLAATFNIELANGAEGYIPPPEQHRLGGYTTWPARTAGLEEQAEPKIVETVLQLLEKVSGAKRRPQEDQTSLYSQAVLQDSPSGYWRLNDLSGPTPRQAVGKAEARWEECVAFGLPGVQREGGAISAPPEKPSPFAGPDINRAAYLAGGRLRVDKPGLGKRYSAEFWFWNALPANARPITGYLFSRGSEKDSRALGEHLGIGGTHGDVPAGKLFFYTGNGVGKVVSGKTPLRLLDWHHVVISRDERKLTVYLDGRLEVETELNWTLPDETGPMFFGGRCDGFSGFEGKLDEVAFYPQPLTAEQVTVHFKASERAAPNVTSREPESKPKSPAESLRSLHLPPGFEASIVAAEPQVLDPVAFDWDEQGRLWVVEMADYPLGLDNAGAAGGRIRILTDRDGDGRHERSVLFAEGLNFPNGIITWRGGCIVTAAPDILFLEDRNNDGEADHKEVLFTGLSEGNQQLRANGLRWGLDNWIYVAAGGHHGKHGADTRLLSSRTGQLTLVGSRDFRIRPDTGEVEAQSGPTQFGRNRDDWGHWFGTQNSYPLWHYVLPDHYLKRNPHLPAPDGRVQLPGGANPPVHPASPPEKRYHSFQQAGRYTSACGGMVYQDSLLFPAGETHAFIAEPFHNLVQHLKLNPEGASFSAARPEPEGQPDFFASEDRWCRPVMMRTGPDGALWVADMYRYMIEHPHWLPKEGKEDLLPHYRLGDDMGRIYRITRSGLRFPSLPKFSSADTPSLVASLDSSNGWVRDKAQQLLLWKADVGAEKPLRHLAETSARPQTRLQAWCTLEGLGLLKAGDVIKALEDPHAGVRENALRLAEAFSSADVVHSACMRVKDADAKVRLQLAFSLGSWNQPEAGETLARLLNHANADEWLTTACLSSALPHLSVLVRQAKPEHRISLLHMAFAEKDRDSISSLLEPAFEQTDEVPASSRWRLLEQFLQVARNRKQNLTEFAKAGDRLSSLLAQNDRVLAEARHNLATSKSGSGPQMAAAALLLQDDRYQEEATAFLLTKLSPSSSPETWREVLVTLKPSGSEQLPSHALEQWASLSPELRQLALDAMLSRESWTLALLKALEERSLPTRDIDAAHRLRLSSHPDKKVQERAGTVFASSDQSTRNALVEKYQPSLALKTDAARGHAVYQRTCAACHMLGKEGRSVGPDLATVAAHPAEKILVNILDPNRDIQPGYHAYTGALASGEQIFGLVAGESASSITFRLPDGSSRSLLRKDVSSLKSLGVSLMPEGLEAALTQQDMADLIAFLKAGGKAQPNQ